MDLMRPTCCLQFIKFSTERERKGVDPGANSAKTTEPEHAPNMKLVMKNIFLGRLPDCNHHDQIKDPSELSSGRCPVDQCSQSKIDSLKKYDILTSFFISLSFT